MSKPYSPSADPEFATQHDYSDILGTSLPPTKPRNLDSIIDPWATDIAIEPAHLPLSSPPIVDPWATDITTEPQQDASLSAKITNQSTSASQSPRHSSPSPRVTTPVIPRQERQSPSTPTEESPASASEIASAAPAVTAKDLAVQYCERGKKSLAAKDYAQARSAYKIAVEWNPQLAIAHAGTAQVCDEIQDYEGALVAWDLAIRCDSTQLDFYYRRALLNKLLKNYYQVLADCKHILERDPDRSSARWLNAIALVKLEHYQVALPSLDQHIQDYPKDPNGYCYRGICYERLDQLPAALLDLDRAIAIQSNHPVFHHARGRARQKSGDLSGAVADFNITIDRKPQATVYDDRAEVRRCLGDRLEALQDCHRAIELNPKFINAYVRRGLIYTELGNLELALIDFNTTIDLEPQHVDAHIQRSWIHFRKQDYRRAKRDCQTVKNLSQSCFWSYYMAGVVASLSGMKHNAIENFSKAMEISPHYVSARYHRGIVYHELGELPKAMVDFQEARSIQDRGLERLVDRDETGFYAEGIALYHMGLPEAARTVLILGALSAKRFNNPSFRQLILSQIEALGLASGELAGTASHSCSIEPI